MTTRSLIASLALAAAGLLAVVPTHAGAAPPDAGQRATRIDYPGHGVEVARLSGDERLLRGTPAGFKRFVHARLDSLFRDAGSRPRCATSPTVVVQRYHAAGWASAGEGWYTPCPGGGYAVIYQRTGSHWRSILGTQEARFCQDLTWYGVPGFVAGRTCVTEDFEAVRYRTHDDRSTSPEATARRAVSDAGGDAVVPARHVTVRAVRQQLRTLVDDGAYLSVERCVTAGDGDPLTASLGDAAYGCAVTASHHRRPDTTYLLRMAPQGDDVLVTEVVPVA